MHRKRPMIRLLISVALSVLFLAAVATSILAQSTSSTQALQRLTNDLALQLDLTYKHDLATHRERYDEMAAALKAWNRSRRTDADYAMMDQWLRTAIRNSMPGAGQPLPAPPEFAALRPSVTELPPPRPTTSAPRSVAAKPKPAPPGPVATQPKPAVAAPVPMKPVPVAPPTVAARPAPRDFWSNHPAARPLDTSNPFRDDPTPQPRPAPSAVAAAAPPAKPAVESPTERTAMRLPVIEAAEVAVNLPELATRIGGYNQALRRIEAAVIAADRAEAEELAKLLLELEQLNDQRDFIDLYVVGLTPQERAATPQLEAPDAALSLIEEKITDRINSPAAKNSSTERDILAALVRKLAELQRKLPETP